MNYLYFHYFCKIEIFEKIKPLFFFFLLLGVTNVTLVLRFVKSFIIYKLLKSCKFKFKSNFVDSEEFLPCSSSNFLVRSP